MQSPAAAHGKDSEVDVSRGARGERKSPQQSGKKLCEALKRKRKKKKTMLNVIEIKHSI